MCVNVFGDAEFREGPSGRLREGFPFGCRQGIWGQAWHFDAGRAFRCMPLPAIAGGFAAADCQFLQESISNNRIHLLHVRAPGIIFQLHYLRPLPESIPGNTLGNRQARHGNAIAVDTIGVNAIAVNTIEVNAIAFNAIA